MCEWLKKLFKADPKPAVYNTPQDHYEQEQEQNDEYDDDLFLVFDDDDD